MLACLLCFGPKDGVATTDIGHNRMAASLHIAQRNPMFLARFATILVAGASREEAAEDAMFGVENGQMLIGNDFELVGAKALR